jgi:hypothetical protein
MTHATEGTLQAYLDGEMGSAAAAELADHLGRCPACAADLRELESAGARFHDAVTLVAAEPPVLRARAALAAAGRPEAAVARAEEPASRWRAVSRLGAGSFAKAAMLLLALAGAGAAAIPGSPVRRALETTFARVAQFFAPAVPVAVDPAVHAPAADGETVVTGSRMGVLPSAGQVRVVLETPSAGALDVTVRLVDEPLAHVATAPGDGVRFRTGPGRIEATDLPAGAVTIEIPRAAVEAEVEVGGVVYAVKRGSELQLTGPAGAGRGEQVRFRIGT